MVKISIIGAGAVGSLTAFLAAQKNLGDIVLLDIVENLAKGKALDISQSLDNVHIVAGSNYALTKNSDIIVVTAGTPRKPNMTREDLVLTNAKIIVEVSKKLATHSPNAIIVAVTNPLDAMTALIKEVTGFPKERVFGMAGVLDSKRMTYFTSRELSLSSQTISALVMGSHGQAMVPMKRFLAVGGVPLTHLMPLSKVNEIVERTKFGGAEIINLLVNQSTSFAPATSVCEMLEAIVHDKREVLPCCAFVEGEYGLHDIYIGVPVVLGKNGVERVIEVELSEDENSLLLKAAGSIKEMIRQAKTLI